MGFLDTLDYIAMLVGTFTGGMLALQAAGQLMKRPLTANRVIGAGMFVCGAVLLLSLALGFDRWPRFALPLYGVHVPMYFLLAPLLNSYFRGTAENRPDGKILPFPGYLWLLPFFIAAAIFLPSLLLPPDLKLAFLERRIENPYLSIYREVVHGVTFAGILSLGYGAGRAFYELRNLALMSRGGDTPVLWHVRVMALWLALMMAASIAAQLVDTVSVKRLVAGLIAAVIIWLYLLDYRYARFFHRLDREIRARNERYTKSKIENIDAQAMIARLDRIMIQDHLYADEDLSLAKLAGMVNIHPSQLSELMNNVIGMDFRQYVSRHRVEAAKRMLLEEPERSALSIGLAAGFNSKASFNRNFKAIAGQTPQEFRAARQASEDQA